MRRSPPRAKRSRPLLVAFVLLTAAPRRAGADEAPAADAPSAPAVDEVRITGRRRATSSPTEHRLPKADVRVLPGAFGDPFRAIEILPGVVPTVSGLPYYYVRGAPPSAVGYFIDEVRVPYLFHFALGPSVIQPALIDEVSLHPAAFPARFGRYAGAVVVGKTREPATALRGEGNVRVFDLGAYVEAPFANGRASAGVGGRYAYTAALFSIFSPDTTIDYRDYNARVSVDLDDRWRASAFTFGSYDYASQMVRDPELREQVYFASEFHRLDLRLDRRGADGSESRVAATIGFDRSRIEGARFAQDVLVGARARHGVPVRPDLDVEVGLDTMIDNYAGDLPVRFAVTREEYANARALFASHTDTATGAWASSTWHPRKGFELTGTARVDFFSSEGVTAVAPSPRTSMRVPIDERVAFLGALGISAQPPAISIPIPAVGYRRIPGGLGYGFQKSAGFETRLPLGFTGRAVGFHHTYSGLRDFARTSRELELDFRPDPQVLPGAPSQAYGLELFLARKLSGRLGLIVSYTLSRAALGSRPNVPARVNPFDRTHVFQIAGSADLGRGWRASVRFLTYRGWPDEGSDSRGVLPIGRLSPFYRFDTRIEKRWSWRDAGHISVILEGLNVTASREVVSRTCDGLVCRNDVIGPVIVPSLGVEGAL